MKTLTVTISDDAAAELESRARENNASVERVAAQIVEDAVDDWRRYFSAEDVAAIEQGMADAERGAFASDDEVADVFNRFGR